MFKTACLNQLVFSSSGQLVEDSISRQLVQENHDCLMECHSALLTVSDHLLIFELAVWFYIDSFQ